MRGKTRRVHHHHGDGPKDDRRERQENVHALHDHDRGAFFVAKRGSGGGGGGEQRGRDALLCVSQRRRWPSERFVVAVKRERVCVCGAVRCAERLVCLFVFFSRPHAPHKTRRCKQTNFKDYPGKQFVVTRRYSDFAWLKQVLNEKLEKEKEGGTIGWCSFFLLFLLSFVVVWAYIAGE